MLANIRKDGLLTETNFKNYYPDADRKTVFEEALEFQDFVADLLLKEMGLCISNYSSRYYQNNYGENRQGIEIKLDTRILETKNVSIEVAEKSKSANANWIPSGIMRKDNSWLYIQGNKDIVFIFSKKYLQQIYKVKYSEKFREPKPTIRTFLIPLEFAYKWAIKFFDLRQNTS